MEVLVKGDEVMGSGGKGVVVDGDGEDIIKLGFVDVDFLGR